MTEYTYFDLNDNNIIIIVIADRIQLEDLFEIRKLNELRI